MSATHLLDEPSLGPIVGHVTADSARIWIRGNNPSQGRTVGIAAVFEDGEYVPRSGKYFRLHREYFRTGAVDLTGLAPDSETTVRVGVIRYPSGKDDQHNMDDDEVKETLPDPGFFEDALLELDEKKCQAVFKTFPEEADKFSFVFGSCRYPGLLWSAKRADQIFKHVLEEVTAKANPPRFVLMVGDQIYADLMNRHVPVGRADTEEEFLDRYTDAFSTPNMSALLRSVPSYMILDDHEIEDNWNTSRMCARDGRQLFVTAIQTYRSFQWFYSPRNYGNRLFYHFDYGGYPFFVTDGRTQRFKSDRDKSPADCKDNHLLGFPVSHKTGGRHKAQIDELCDWLISQQQAVGDSPKFIVSAGVFTPNGIGDLKDPGSSDSWAAFPNTRRQVLSTIISNNIQNVVFLCGDVHCSIIAELSFFERGPRGLHTKKMPLRAFSITSSAFYWPYLFADGEPGSFVHDSKDPRTPDGFYFGGPDHSTVSTTEERSDDRQEELPYLMHYKAWNFEQEDNYTKVSVTPSSLSIELTSRDGKKIPAKGKTRLVLA